LSAPHSAVNNNTTQQNALDRHISRQVLAMGLVASYK